MKAKVRALSTYGWPRPCEIIDVGVGVSLREQTGLSGEEIGALVVDVFHQLTDGGSNSIRIEQDKKVTAAFVVRRGSRVEVGNRPDFEFLGWGKICDLFEKRGDLLEERVQLWPCGGVGGVTS